MCVAGCALALLAATPVLAQQSNSDSSNHSSQSASQDKPTSQDKPQSQQPAAPAHKDAAQENPFPSDVSRQAAQQQQGDSSTAPPASAPDAPDADKTTPPPAQKQGQAAQDNPFPEDVSKGAAAAASKAADSGASSSSSSSSSSNAGADPADSDPNGNIPPTTGRRKLRKPSDKDIQSGSIAGEGRAKDDVKIGHFYLGDGNYQGAYGRFSEAARLDPNNVDAVYGLAASAEGLHHSDEALTNYRLYLAIAPDGDHAKSAEKAIHALAK